jgi:CspA family cold shock protein
MGKTEKLTGKVKWFNEQKGFGYITADDGTDYFVHRSGIKKAHPKTIVVSNLEKDDVVEFTIQDAPKGPQAVSVTVVDDTDEATE